MLLLSLACGIDNTVNGDDDPKSFEEDTSPFTLDTGDTETTVPTEECNGVDDDGDGEVDEGFEDLDANGRADCMDQECPTMAIAAAGDVVVVEECSGGTADTVEDAFAVREQWSITEVDIDPSLTSSANSPLVVNLDDDNGDGSIDEDDVPEVVLSMFAGVAYNVGSLVVLDGATGLGKWTQGGVGGVVTPAVGDFDGDGRPDIATINSSGRVVCFEGDGTTKWTSSTSVADPTYGVVTAADLDADGIAEVIADNVVVAGDDGSLRFEMSASGSYSGATAADLDLDGLQEVLFEGAVYNSDGDRLWSTSAGISVWPVVIQADADDEAEVGWVADTWKLFEDDGTEIFSTSIASLHPGPPCAGDFDGDGAAEVAWPTGNALVLAELDGTISWEVPSTDASGLSGCSGYDLDADGALEILYADELSMKIFDGRTGDVLYENINHNSGTLYETPTVADIDHDDHAEILFVSNFQTGATPGLTVLEHDGDGWPRSGTTWGLHDFAVTNINPDGSVPREPDPSWLAYNLFRARPAVDDPANADLVVAIVDRCIADCTYGPAQVQVQVSNQGGQSVSAGAQLSIYAESESGPLLLLTDTLPEVPAGTALEGLVYDVDAALIGKFGFRVVVDDDGAGDGDVAECDETNNEDAWLDSVCP